MIYRDFIITFIFGVLSSTITPISLFSEAFVSKACLRLFVKIYMVYRDLIRILIFTLPVRYSNGYFVQDLQGFYQNVDLWCIKIYHHTNFHI